MKKHSTIIIISIIAILFVAFAVYFTVFAVNGDKNDLDNVKTGNILCSYTHNGINRLYYLYIPSDLPKNAPLVIALHGYTGSAKDFMKYSTWDEVAEENKFIVCYPQGTNDVYQNQPHWNARIIYSLTDDVGFLSNLALNLVDEYSLDRDKIFATGFSNGGYMSYTLACERPDVFRAVAPVSALMSEFTYYSYNPLDLEPKKWLEHPVNTPIPICHIHGAMDGLIQIDGGGRDEDIERIWGGGPSVADTVSFWAGINRCTQETQEDITDNVTKTIYSNPKNDTQVWYYKVDNMPHLYPTIKYDDMDISASEEIWKFFSMYD